MTARPRLVRAAAAGAVGSGLALVAAGAGHLGTVSLFAAFAAAWLVGTLAVPDRGGWFV